MFWLLLIYYIHSIGTCILTVLYPFYFIEEKMLLYVWGMRNLDLYHTLVEGSDNLWLIIATKNKKKMTTSLKTTNTLRLIWCLLSSNYQFPFWMRSCPTPIWLSFWDNQIKFLITLHVGTTTLHVGTTVHVIILYIATARVYVGTTNSFSLL